MNSQGLRVGTIGNENLHRREDPGREPIALKDLQSLFSGTGASREVG